MKKTTLFLLFLLFILSASGSEWINIRSSKPEPAKVQLTSATPDRSTIHFTLTGYNLNPVKTDKGDAWTVSIENATPVLAGGSPDLPKLTASLIIPDLAGMDIRVVSSSYQDYPDLEIAPSKGNILRNVDPSTIPYTYGKSYSLNKFFPGSLTDSREPYILRDFRGQTFIIYPFQYNPVTKVLRVYYDLTIEVVKVSDQGINPLVRKEKEIKVDKEFISIYNSHFLNMGVTSYTPLNDYGKLLVICHGPFMQAIRPYVNWKNSIGYPTKLVDVATIGTTSTAIKNYIQAYYNSNGLTFVLLVGDGPQIPTNQGGGLGGPSDNAYGYLAGNDHYSEIFVGRFSAENAAQVETQVNRTINYEKSPQFITDDWYKTVLGIASDQGPGDDNEYDYQHIRNQQTQLLGYTYSSNPELFDGSQGGNDAAGDPNPSMVATEVNGGTGLILYCGHGSQNAWSSSGFSSSDVNGLTNQGKLPFIFSVACVNGDFVTGSCFAEAWLRASQGGQPTGAVAFLGSTINQSWDPPMCGQDEMTDILAESYASNIKRTFAGITINGCMKMNDEYGADGEEMTDTWNIFGDPTVQVRTSTPLNLTVTHDLTLFVGGTTLNVTCNVNGARATVSLNDSLQATGIVTNNLVTLTFPALPVPNDSLHLVVTAYNYIPYISDIPIITPNGPYIVYSSNHVNDTTGNNNDQADYGEEILLTVYLKNVGVFATTNLTAKLRCTDPKISLADTSEVYGAIAPNQVKSVVNGFKFNIANNIPDGHSIPFNICSDDGTSTWNSGFTITAHAPALAPGIVIVKDSTGNNNGRLDPGETAFLKVFVKNTGSAAAYNVISGLVAINPYITLVDDQQNYGEISGGGNVWKYFQVTVDATAPQGQTAPFMLEITADKGVTGSGSFNLIIGRIPVLIADLDGNTSSGPALKSAAEQLGIMTNYRNGFTADSLMQYSSVFVCLGVFPDNTSLTSLQGQWLASYLNQGGRLYMEGGDTWYYDAQTAVHPMFHITPQEDGSGDLSSIGGMSGTFTEGMNFTYSGENMYIDRLVPGSQAYVIFDNQSPSYHTAIAYDAGTYKTIGTSFEFAGLTDGAFPSTKNNLMSEYLNFFGIQPPPLQANFIGFPTEIHAGESVSFTDFSTGGITTWNWNFPGGMPSSSAEKNPVITYSEPGTYDVTLEVTNGSATDQMIKTGYIVVDFATSVEKQNLTDHFSIYPNPSKGNIYLENKTGKDQQILVDIINGQGISLFQITNIEMKASERNSLDLHFLAEGVYFLKITGKDFTITKKLILQK